MKDDKPTQKQLDLLEDLCQQLGGKLNMKRERTRADASRLIGELLDKVNQQKIQDAEARSYGSWGEDEDSFHWGYEDDRFEDRSDW